MILLFLSIFISNSYSGTLLFQSEKPSSFYFYKALNLSLFFTLLSLFFTQKLELKTLLMITYIPLLIGLISFYFNKFNLKKQPRKNLQTTVLFLEITLVHMRRGRSFHESLNLSKNILERQKNIFIFIKNNVVLQQPKSRFSGVFHQLEKDLNQIFIQKIGQKDLISLIKRSYETNIILHDKIKISISQYKTQSGVISIFWLCSLAFLFFQEDLYLYKSTVLISFFLLILGASLSKKLLIKSDFQL